MSKKVMKKAVSRAAKAKPAAKKAAPKISVGRGKELAWLTPAKLKEIRTDLVKMRDDILKTVRKQQVG